MTDRPLHRTVTQSGSAFWIILIAIALFAGLSYALMSGSRNNASTLTQDQARIAALDIISYSDTVAQGFQKLKLKGCAESQISVFDAAQFKVVAYNNASSPSDKSCWIFNQNGGSIVAQQADDKWFDFTTGFTGRFWMFNATNSMDGVGISSTPDLLFVLPSIKREICVQINNTLGIGQKDAEPPNIGFGDTAAFSGTFPNTASVFANSTTAGKTSFCLIDGAENVYKYVRVVLVR